MNTDKDLTSGNRQLAQLIDAAATSTAALILANEAADLDEQALYSAAIYRAVGLNRADPDALLQLAGVAGASGDLALAAIALMESARFAPLPAEVQPFLDNLTARTANAPELTRYRAAVRQTPFYRVFVAAPAPLRICAMEVTPVMEEALGLLRKGNVQFLLEIAQNQADTHRIGILARANLFVHPSPAANPPEVIEAYSSGLVVLPADDPGRLATSLAAFARNPDAFAPLQAQAQDRAAAYLEQSAATAQNITASAEAAARQSQWDRAAALSAQAIKTNPFSAVPHNLLGRALSQLGRIAESLPELRRAIDLEPDSAQYHFDYGVAALQTGAATESLRALEEALRLDAGSPAGLLWLGFAEKRLGRLNDALRHHRQALGAKPPKPGRSHSPRRVVFVVQHGPQWPSMQPVYEAFRDDPGWQTTLVALPYQHTYTSPQERDAIFGFLAAEKLKFLRLNEVRDEITSADIVFLQNPYDVTRPEGWRTEDLLRVVPRLAYVPYGVEIGGGEMTLSCQFNLPLQQLAWAVFSRSNRHRSLYDRYCIAGNHHVFVTGHPRMDTLRRLSEMAPDAEFEGFAQGRPIVFWNPQFDLRPDGKGFSTFLEWERFLPEEFARRQNLVLVVRPHPLFFGTLEKRGIWTNDQVADFLGRLKRAGNILVDRRESYLPIFAASAAMLSDASSFLLEYAGTGKPLLYLHNPRGPQLNEDGEFVWNHCYTAQTRAEIAAFLDLVEQGRDPKGDARRDAYGEFMYAPGEGVGVAIRNLVTARIDEEDRS